MDNIVCKPYSFSQIISWFECCFFLDEWRWKLMVSGLKFKVKQFFITSWIGCALMFSVYICEWMGAYVIFFTLITKNVYATGNFCELDIITFL